MSEGRTSRRGFLREFASLFGFAGKAFEAARREAFCRPPGAVGESIFLARCDGVRGTCRRCAEICPERCILIATERKEGGPPPGTPFLLPASIPCTLCGECGRACPTQALLPLSPWAARIGEAVVDLDRCRAGRPHGCRLCLEACPFPGVAIRLTGTGDPEVRFLRCAGCGLCAAACPARAISILPRRSVGR